MERNNKSTVPDLHQLSALLVIQTVGNKIPNTCIIKAKKNNQIRLNLMLQCTSQFAKSQSKRQSKQIWNNNNTHSTAYCEAVGEMVIHSIYNLWY